MQAVRYLGNTYYYDPDKPHCYYYEKEQCTNCISYIARDYGGNKYKLEWRILGTRDKAYTIRMTEKLAPWDVIHQGHSPYLGALHESGI